MGMIFVRNANGSHNPREAMALDDFVAGATLLTQLLSDLLRRAVIQPSQLLSPRASIGYQSSNAISTRPACMSRHPPGRRADYRWFHAITTRWMDNDVFQHVNNVNYFSFFDTAVTYYEMTERRGGPAGRSGSLRGGRGHVPLSQLRGISRSHHGRHPGGADRRQFGALRDRRVPQRRRCGGGGRLLRARLRRSRDAAAGAGAGGVRGRCCEAIAA